MTKLNPRDTWTKSADERFFGDVRIIVFLKIFKSPYFVKCARNVNLKIGKQLQQLRRGYRCGEELCHAHFILRRFLAALLIFVLQTKGRGWCEHETLEL